MPYETLGQLGTDLITNLPKTKKGYNTIVTVIDYTSKFVEANALKSKCAVRVAEFMYELVCRHGAAKVYISDQGREFVNNIADKFYELTNIKHNITSAYHPQANGEVERFNRTTQEAFLKMQEFQNSVFL